MSLRISSLTKSFDGADGEIKALDGITLSIGDGEFVAIVGESGSGKTTLLNQIAGLDKPSGGKIMLDDIDIAALSPDALAKLRRKRIGVIYQFYNLVPELTVRDNITLPIELDGDTIDEERLAEIISAVGLTGRERDYPSMLSGGQQQRAAIARAIFQAPDILLADEPTGNLDSQNSREVMKLLCELNEQYEITLIIVTHSDLVAKMAKRVIKLDDGKVIEDKKNL